MFVCAAAALAEAAAALAEAALIPLPAEDEFAFIVKANDAEAALPEPLIDAALTPAKAPVLIVISPTIPKLLPSQVNLSPKLKLLPLSI